MLFFASNDAEQREPEMPQTKPIILVDGSSYLYRAYHALPALMNSKGNPTGAVYGIINMLKRLMTRYEPEHIAVIFDPKGKTFRHTLYEAYKAHRPPMPPELVAQIQPVHDIIRAMGIPVIMVEGMEADDVIGTLATHAEQHQHDVLISTGDKDLAQLVDARITLINTMTDTLLDPPGVKEKFGVTPEQIIDYLTLVGDTSDNIPGVDKVGPKTAAKWLQAYGSLDNLITHQAEIPGKVGENFRASLKHLPLSKTLVTIKRDVDLTFDIENLILKPVAHETLVNLFKELEFKSWLAELLTKAPATLSAHDHKKNYVTILDKKTYAEWIARLNAAESFAIDTETNNLNAINADLIGLSFATKTGEAAYVPVAHDYEGAPTQLTRAEVLAQLKPLLENPQKKKIGQNIKYDMEIFANYDIGMQGIAYDTMLESYVLDSTGSHGLDALSLKYLGIRTISYEDVAGKGSKQITFNQVTLEKAGEYAAEDADITLRLHHALWPRLAKEKSLQKVFTDIELPLISVLARMEHTGVLIDPQLLAAQGETLQARLTEIEKEAYAIAGQSFNINSPKQLQEILFDVLKLPVLQKTPTGQASTADPVLQELALEFALPSLIIEYRSLSKLISTYTSRLVEEISPRTGRIHTSYHQAGTATGRCHLLILTYKTFRFARQKAVVFVKLSSHRQGIN